MKITRDDALKILGVNEDSSPDEIRSCYKKLALKWHPDKHGDSNVSKDEATLKFQEVSAAYKRLTTNADDGDDEIDDNEFMNIREMMELFAHIFFHNGVRGCPHHGMDCCDYEDDDYFYSDDDYYDYTDDESEDEFLDSIAHRLRNKFEQRKYKRKDNAQTQRHSITEEEALRNARQLIEEEELEKKREEKKKQKRKKKKEKKKQKDKEKKEQEILTTNIKTDELSNSQNSNKENSLPTDINIEREEKQATKPQPDNNTNGKKSKANEVDNKKNSSKLSNCHENQHITNKKDNNCSNKKNKTTSADHDEDCIDTNSAFFARAASKAPPVVHNGIIDHHKENNNKKKKSNNQSHPINDSITTTATNNTKKAKNKPQTQSPHPSTTSPPTTIKTTIIPTIIPPTIVTTNHNTSQHPAEKAAPLKDNTVTIPTTNHIPEKTETSLPVNNVILQSRQVAVQGNQLAQQGDHLGAVKMFTKAIQLDPTDFRFFGNRSYCYDRLEQYDKALSDADASIGLAPEWPKGIFRKGRALTGLKRFQEAEQVFQQVLKLDPECEDAQFELARVRVQILMDMGFVRSMSEQAVRTYSTVQQALEALLAGKVSDEEGSDEVYISDDDDIEEENQHLYSTVQNNKKSTNKQAQRQSQPQPQPKCTALWVGNVDPQLVTEKQMSQLFSKCGKVSSVRILPHKYCAFVNYVEPNSALLAMEKLQRAGLGCQKLLLRFPNNPPPGSFVPEPSTVNTEPQQQQQQQQTKTSPSVSESSNDSSKASGPVNGNECYFWRTTGCVFENQCRYKHVRGHKGVDLSKVQAKYGKIPAS